MTTKAGVGHSREADTNKAAESAARQAMEKSGASKPDLVWIYSTSKHDSSTVRDAVRKVVGDQARMVGGASMGVITDEVVSYGGAELAVAVIESDQVRFDAFNEDELPDRELEVGQALAEQIQNQSYEGEPTCVLMFDSVRGQQGGAPMFNIASRFLEGFAPKMQDWEVIGHGLLSDPHFSPYEQWFDDEVLQNSATAVVISGGVKAHVEFTHGCSPASGYLKVTKAQGNVIQELDGRPALDVITDLFGDTDIEQFPMYVTLGRNLGDKFAPPEESSYATRNMMAIDSESKAIVLTEIDVQEGMEVQIMRRKIDFEQLRERWSNFLERVRQESGDPFFALYLNCGGRTGVFANTEGEDSDVLREVIGGQVPLLGTYSACEMARVRDQLMSLSWTGILAVFTEA